MSKAWVGNVAQLLGAKLTERVAVTRPVSAGSVWDHDHAVLFLRKLLQQAAVGSWRPGRQAVTGVRGCVSPVARAALARVLRRVGFAQATFINAAIASAVGSGLPIHGSRAQIICDLGAATTDVTIMSLGRVIHYASCPLGGDQIDQALARWLHREFGTVVDQQEVRRLKHRWNPSEPATRFWIRRRSAGVPVERDLPSDGIWQAMRPTVDLMFSCLDQVLAEVASGVATELVSGGIVLVGGGAKLAGIAELVEQRTGLKARVAPEAQHCLIRGLQHCLENLDAWKPILQAG